MKPNTTTTALLLSTFAATALSQAPTTQNNPAGASIQATLFAFNVIQGSITGVTPANASGTSFNINFFDFPTTGAPFSYYISSASSIPNGDCASLTSPFNPYSASATCKPSDPANCAIGSLSAKHGAIAPTGGEYSFQVFYTDDYLSTKPGAEAYFGGRAIVLADKSGKPLNCAMFPGTAVKESGGAGGSSTASATATSATSAAGGATTSVSTSGGTPTSATAVVTSTAAAAGRIGAAGAGALVAAVAALVV